MSLESPNFLERRPKWQVVGAILLLVLASYGFVFWLGTIKAREWADSEYLQEREANAKKLAVLEQQNDALKKENEARAEIQKQTDSANDIKRIAELNRLQEERNERNKAIDATPDADQLCGLCEDAKRSGFPLSDATCGRCSAAAEVSR